MRGSSEPFDSAQGERVRLVLCLALALSSVAHAAEAPVRFDVVYRELPNLVYQLDCVSGATHGCSRAAYQAWWDKQLLRDADDRAALDRWRAVHQRYGELVQLEIPVALPLGRRGDVVALEARLRIAGLLATSVEDFVSRVDVLVLPADRATLSEVLKRFEPRFRPLWQAQAKAGQAFAADLTRVLQRKDVVELTGKLRAFYDGQVPADRPLPFVVLDRPDLGADKATHGEQVDGVSLLEFLPGERASSRVDVALHELCHFFLFTARPQTVAALQQRFVASKVKGAVAGWRLFDEAVATALGNGMVQRLVERAEFDKRLARPGGFYNDPDIDRAAKALLPWLDGWIGAGRAVTDPEFADGYLATLEKEYGAELAAPRLAMFTVLLFEDEALGGKVNDALHERFHLNSVSSVRGTLDDPEVAPWYAEGHGTAIFVVPPAHLAGLVAPKVLTAEEVRMLRPAKRLVLFGKPRGNGEWLYVVLAADAAAAAKVFDELAKANAPLDGLLLAPLPADAGSGPG